MIQIYKNEDVKLTITLTARDTNGVTVPVDLTTLSGFAVWLSYQNSTNFMKFSYNGIAVDGTNMTQDGFQKIRIINAKQGKFQVVINAPDTVNSVVGILNLDCKIQFTDDYVLTKKFHKVCNPIKSFAQIIENVMETPNNL